jgi:uncharacterized membrane protein YhaH (DUF805 family)
MKIVSPTPSLLTAACYLGCILVVVFYVNLFFLYEFLQARFGQGVIKWSPFLLPPALLLAFLAGRSRLVGITSGKRDKFWVVFGIFLCIIALLLPDPQIAVKRIHVTEYLLLALLTRFTLSFHHSGRELLFFSALFAALLGIHDEFLQGLHPLRTYGLKDMAVNICSAMGGACIWHGLQLFYRTNPQARVKKTGVYPLAAVYLAWLLISVFGLAIPVSIYLESRIPLWPILPLGAALLFWVLYYPTMRKSSLHHGLSTLTYTSLSFFLYPIIGYVFQAPFY